MGSSQTQGGDRVSSRVLVIVMHFPNLGGTFMKRKYMIVGKNRNSV